MGNIFVEINRQLLIKEVVQRYAPVQFNRNNQCCCPIHQEKTPSFTVYPDTNTFKCYGCGISGDCVAFVAKFKGISNVESVKQLQADFGLKLHQNDKVENKPKPKDFKHYLQQCSNNIGETKYFQSRGLSEETIKRFNLGYDEARNQVVIPYNRKFTYYQARLISPEKKFFKPRNEVAGSEPVYNEDLLRERDIREPVFVVESPICAMSIMQLGAKAVATCGSSGVNKFAEVLKHLKPKPAFIISLDNDEPGKSAAKELEALFRKEKIKHITYSVSGSQKDPNDLLQKNPAELKANIQKAREQFFRQTTSFGDLVPLTEIMATRFPPKDWLIKGMICGGLGLLAAPPKTGKSFFALDMCLSIASGTQFLGFETMKQSVWYMAMEDEQSSIKERCKMVWKNKPFPKGLKLSFKDNYRLTDKSLNENNDDPDALKSLTDYMETVLYADPSIKLIVIDTFQLVRSEEKKGENIYKGEYRETRILKNFVTKHNVCIILVHHTRKGKDESNEFNEVSGSTAMTGGVDFVLKITKKKVSDSNATLSLLSRNVWLESQSIEFERENCKWIRIGSEKEQQEQKAKEEYYKNEFRKTIVNLVEKGGGTWQGTITNLLEECGRLLGHSPSIVNPTQVSKEITRLEPLLLLHDGIAHAAPNKNGGKLGRPHLFYYKHKEVKQLTI